MTLDPYLGCFHQHHTVGLALPGLEFPGKPPGMASLRAEIPAFHPVSRLVPVTPSGPTPQGTVDLTIDVGKSAFARCVPMIEGPTLDLRRQRPDQLSGCHRGKVRHGWVPF